MNLKEPFRTMKFFWDNRYAYSKKCNADSDYRVPGYQLLGKQPAPIYFNNGNNSTKKFFESQKSQFEKLHF